MSLNLVVPVDGTPLAERALPWALALADRRPGSAVHVVEAHLSPVPVVVEGAVVADPTADAVLREKEDEYLAALARRLTAAAPGAAVTVHHPDTDEPTADAVLAVVRAVGADLVVMATHGRGPVARFVLGSTTDATVRHSPVPVLVVRADDAPADLTARPAVRHVLVPLDGTPLAEAILPAAGRLAAAFGAEVELLAVLPDDADPDAPLAPAGGSATAYLAAAADRVQAHTGRRPRAFVRHGDPAVLILAAAAEKPGGLVALATHGRGGLSRLVLGSVADAVVRGGVGPTLVFHPVEAG